MKILINEVMPQGPTTFSSSFGRDIKEGVSSCYNFMGQSDWNEESVQYSCGRRPQIRAYKKVRILFLLFKEQWPVSMTCDLQPVFCFKRKLYILYFLDVSYLFYYIKTFWTQSVTSLIYRKLSVSSRASWHEGRLHFVSWTIV